MVLLAAFVSSKYRAHQNQIAMKKVIKSQAYVKSACNIIIDGPGLVVVKGPSP